MPRTLILARGTVVTRVCGESRSGNAVRLRTGSMLPGVAALLRGHAACFPGKQSRLPGLESQLCFLAV